MSISRRGFFGMLAGLAAAPVVAPLAKMFPATTYTTYLLGDSEMISWAPNTVYKDDGGLLSVSGPCEPLYFRCGSAKMGTLYWSKSLSE